MGCVTTLTVTGNRPIARRLSFITVGVRMLAAAFVMCALCLASLPVQAGSAPAVANDAMAYLNTLRQRACMAPFSSDAALSTAAVNHALYLETNNLTGHFESSMLNGFTGFDAVERAAGVGYPTILVSENISNGQDSGMASVDDLFSAIYHRIGFLDPEVDEVGVGATDNQTYVYNMGNQAVATLCQNPQTMGAGTFQLVCAGNAPLHQTDFDTGQNAVRIKSPAVIPWPANGDSDVPPVFYEESPDPLPDRSVSGYPVSLVFNPLYAGSVELLDFQLFEGNGGAEITNTRLLDRLTDPNSELDERQFALFPLQRLDWSSPYRAKARYRVDGVEEQREWQFCTRDLGLPVFTLEQSGQVFSVGAGSVFAVYIPPTLAQPSIGGIGFGFSGGASVDVSFIDQNTLRVATGGSPGGEITVNSAAGNFSVALTGATPATAPAAPGASMCRNAGSAVYYPASGDLVVDPITVTGVGTFKATLTLALDGVLPVFRIVCVDLATGSFTAGGQFDFGTLTLHLPRAVIAGDTSGLSFDVTLRLTAGPVAQMAIDAISINPS